MNKLFPIVLALFYFSICLGTKSDNEWTKENEIFATIISLYCTESFDKNGELKTSCIKIGFAKCYAEIFKNEFSEKEFNILMSQNMHSKMEENPSPIDYFEERSSKVEELAGRECGESSTEGLLEEYINFYETKFFIFNNRDILSKSKSKLIPHDFFEMFSKSFLTQSDNYKIRINALKDSEDLNSEDYRQLLEIEDKISKLSVEISKENLKRAKNKPNNE